MRFVKQIGFWLVASLLMAALYMGALGSYLNAFALAILLLPGAILLSVLINRFRQETSWRKWLHMAYALLISLWVEWMGLIVAYWFLFELKLERIPQLMVNPVFLWMWMLFFVFVRDRLFYVKKEAPEKEPLFEVLSERKRVLLNLNEVLFIESKNEVCTIQLNNNTHIQTRERISQLEERLPEQFIRIHRSYIVNSTKLELVSKDGVVVNGEKLPVSRSYKEKVSVLIK